MRKSWQVDLEEFQPMSQEMDLDSLYKQGISVAVDIHSDWQENHRHVWSNGGRYKRHCLVKDCGMEQQEI